MKLYHTRSSSSSATNRATWASSPRSACARRRSVAGSRRASIRSGPPPTAGVIAAGWAGSGSARNAASQGRCRRRVVPRTTVPARASSVPEGRAVLRQELERMERRRLHGRGGLLHPLVRRAADHGIARGMSLLQYRRSLNLVEKASFLRRQVKGERCSV